MAAKAATAIRLEALTHRANDSPANAIANRALLGRISLFYFQNWLPIEIASHVFADYVAINVHRINTVSRRKDANHAIVTKVVRRVSSVTNTASVRVTIMSKVAAAIDAKRTSTIAIKDAWIVPTVTIWCKMLPTIIAEN